MKRKCTHGYIKSTYILACIRCTYNHAYVVCTYIYIYIYTYIYIDIRIYVNSDEY